MIYITGDTHGLIDFPKLKNYFTHRYRSKKDILIILGDCGIVWSEEDNSIFEFSCLGPTVLFIDGNHENFDLLDRFPITTVFGAKAHYLNHNVYHILRGEILHILGKTFLCLGGATSIDRKYRIEGISYWEQEHILDQDVERALQNVAPLGNRVDYVLTHCAPSPIVRTMFSYATDKDTNHLAWLKREITFDHWYFGHYHEDKRRGKYRCFHQDILEIPLLDKGTRSIPYHELLKVDDESDCCLRNWKTGRMTKLHAEDLPEWFYHHYEYHDRYYDLSGIKDVAFHRAFFDNHISKDCRFYLSYDGKHPKTKDQEPKNEKDWEVTTWRVDIAPFLLGIEKYSPGLKLDPIKAQINLVYDQYANHHCNWSPNDLPPVRPFPKVKTPRYRSRYGGEAARYEIRHGECVLLSFIKREDAIEYAEAYLEKAFNWKFIRFEQVSDAPFRREYETSWKRSDPLVIQEIEGDDHGD